MSKILSIVIPVFNKFAFTKSCLLDLSRLPNDHEIIVIDNGSSDETKIQLEQSKEIVYHRNNLNLGFAKACNIGYNLSTAANILFLNNDVKVRSDHATWTNNLIKYCDKALVGPTMGQLDDQLNFVKEANCQLSGMSYLSGWCIASSKNIWNKLDISGKGMIFSEEFFCYYEDSDLGGRARKLEIPMRVVDIPVVHFGKTTSKQLNTYQLYKAAQNIFIKKWKNRNY